MPLVANSSSNSPNYLKAVFLAALVTAILIGIPLWRIKTNTDQNRFDDLILAAAGENGCSPCMIKAIVWRETKFDPNARGKDGELGLMQVMPTVAAEWAKARNKKPVDAKQLLDPAMNLRIGSWYFSKALQQWSQSAEPVPIALAQYNAGRSNVLKWIDPASMADAEAFIQRIAFPSTKSYVRDIIKRNKYYEQRAEF